MKKTGFKDTLKPSSVTKSDKPAQWDLRMPQYDDRISHAISAEQYYHTGVTQPIGHLGKCKYEGVLMGHVNTMEIW